MKTILLSIGILSLIIFKGFSQPPELIKYLNAPKLTEKQQHYADAWIKEQWVKSYHYITIDPKLFNGNFLNINLPQQPTLNIEKREVTNHTGGSYSWTGNLLNPQANADFEVHNDMITARISSFNFVYLIYPLSDGIHLLIECDGTNMPMDESEEGYKKMLERAEKSEMDHQNPLPETGNKGINAAGDCKVRILVVFDTQVKQNLADPISYINSCITATNTAYSNSSINFSVELAAAIEETYTESINSTTDVNRFQNNGDGYFDNVFAYRSDFDADMCVLIVENLETGVAGLAYTVANSAYNDPFCVVKRNQAVANLSFPHELGHLYGCRHDPFVDNTNTPYSYGHGYVKADSLWRTVMAYNDQCDCSDEIIPCPVLASRMTPGIPSCARIQYFSNPAVNFNENATGVTNTNDNKQALEASRSNIASLEITETDKTFINPYIFTPHEQSDVIAFNSVTNNSTFELNDSSSGSWRTGNYCLLRPGFWAHTGSVFRAYNDACNTLMISNQPELLTNKIESINLQSILVSPNPFNSSFDLSINLSQDEKAKVVIYNLLGLIVKETLENNLSKGNNKLSFDCSDLAPGVYFIEITIGEIKTIKKIVRS